MGMLGGLTKKTLVLMKLRKKSSAQEVKGQGSQEDSPEIGVDGQERLVPDGGVRFFRTDPMQLEIELTPFMLRQRMRSLFVGVEETGANFRRLSASIGNFRLNSQAFMAFTAVTVPKEKREMTYDLAVHKPNRKWYQPLSAWYIVMNFKLNCCILDLFYFI